MVRPSAVNPSLTTMFSVTTMIEIVKDVAMEATAIIFARMEKPAPVRQSRIVGPK